MSSELARAEWTAAARKAARIRMVVFAGARLPDPLPAPPGSPEGIARSRGTAAGRAIATISSVGMATLHPGPRPGGRGSRGEIRGGSAYLAAAATAASSGRASLLDTFRVIRMSVGVTSAA
jgi:hypothetical protein